MTNHPNRSRVKIPESTPADKKTHGGKRDGAGPPTHSELGEKIMRSYRLAPDVIAILDANRPSGPMIEKLVREYAQRADSAIYTGATDKP